MTLDSVLNSSHIEGDSRIRHGPALFIDHSHTSDLSVDAVSCVRCLSWPPQAAGWPTRHRNHGWPDSATVDHVVNNGCDVVGVAHRQCRQHEWMGNCQFRLSLSRAEIVLINSWMPVQQIVYHMLRVFMKTERLTDNGVNSEPIAASNYHIKTLMLWTCETKPRSWWTLNLNLIKICAELLRILSVWLTEAQCPHYFINNCNLVDSFCNLEVIASQLMSIDKTWLSTWFVNNYIRKCSELCPGNVSRLFSDVSTTMKLQKAVSAVVDWRLNTALEDKWTLFEFFDIYMPNIISRLHHLTVRSCVWWITELSKVDTYWLIYFIAVAYIVSSNGFIDELIDVLATISGLSISTRRHINQHSSELSLVNATKLMKIVAIKSRGTVQLIEIELSKAYLHRALRCRDSDSDSIYCLANVYLALLYYTTGQYQSAIDHCTLVTRSQDHSQCTSHVQGELLPKFDKDINSVLGLAVFYQHIRRAALNHQQTQHVAVFSTEMFAHYLHNRCLSITQTSSNVELCGLGMYIDNTQLLITDVLALKSVYHKFHYRPVTARNCRQETHNAAEQNTSELVELLQKSAVEHFTTHRQFQARDFGSVARIVTTDYEALYAYKRGDYQRCLLLSTQNVHTLLYAISLTGVFTFPMFIHMFDDDMVSLIALTLIVDPESSRVPVHVVITQLTLSLYLMTKCQLTLRHSVMSLVQTINCIEIAQKRLPANGTLDHLTLKMTKHKIQYAKTMQSLLELS